MIGHRLAAGEGFPADGACPRHPLQGAIRGAGRIYMCGVERAELTRPRQENAELAMERKVLKRGVALRVEDTMRRWRWRRDAPASGDHPGQALPT
jgi:hypothetical protein